MAIGKITTDKTHRGHSAIAELLVAFIFFIMAVVIHIVFVKVLLCVIELI